MKRRLLPLWALAYAGLALLFTSTSFAQVRPAIYEESATLHAPDASWEFFGRFGVAIDGDSALVSGERYVTDAGTGATRHEGAAFLYQRASLSSWSYVGQLGPVVAMNGSIRPGLAMKDGVAVTITDNTRVFERQGTAWIFTSYLDTDLTGPDIEISLGRILISRTGCNYNSLVFHKDGSGIWAVEGELPGTSNVCGPTPPPHYQDLEGLRAIVFNGGTPTEQPVARMYVKNETGAGWRRYVELVYHADDYVFGPEVARSAAYTIMNGSRERGTNIINEVNQSFGGNFFSTIQPADGWMQPDAISGTNLERSGPGFVQRNYSYDRGAYVVNLFRIEDDVYHFATHLATLQASGGASLGNQLDSSFNRIIVSGRTSTGGDNNVRIFELPDILEWLLPQVHDFEDPNPDAVWQSIPGSSFAVVTAGNTHVYRQSSTAGDAGAWGPGTWMHNQAIQAEVTVRGFNGGDRWVGLQTRRTGDANYYYVTLRSSGSVQLKRMQNGSFTTLATAPAVVTIGRKYRLRLESIGTAHRVYLDDRLVLTAYDSALAEGNAGFVMYRASADFDNLIVTSNPLTSIYRTDFENGSAGPANWRNLGDWRVVGGAYQQASTFGDARAIAGATTHDQIAQVRVRPTAFAAPSAWAGLLARYEDDGNYLYVSLRQNNTVTLRRLINGQITQMFSAPLTVTPGAWYTIRIEVVAGKTRVYVNDQLTFSTNEDVGPPGPNPGGRWGRVGLVTYKATADYDDFLAYQP